MRGACRERCCRRSSGRRARPARAGRHCAAAERGGGQVRAGLGPGRRQRRRQRLAARRPADQDARFHRRVRRGLSGRRSHSTGEWQIVTLPRSPLSEAPRTLLGPSDPCVASREAFTDSRARFGLKYRSQVPFDEFVSPAAAPRGRATSGRRPRAWPARARTWCAGRRWRARAGTRCGTARGWPWSAARRQSAPRRTTAPRSRACSCRRARQPCAPQRAALCTLLCMRPALRLGTRARMHAPWGWRMRGRPAEGAPVCVRAPPAPRGPCMGACMRRLAGALIPVNAWVPMCSLRHIIWGGCPEPLLRNCVQHSRRARLGDLVQPAGGAGGAGRG